MANFLHDLSSPVSRSSFLDVLSISDDRVTGWRACDAVSLSPSFCSRKMTVTGISRRHQARDLPHRGHCFVLALGCLFFVC